MRRLPVILLALTLTTACALREDERDRYAEQMNSICRSLNERVENIGPAVDPRTIEIDEARVNRVNAAHERANAAAWKEVNAIAPPDALADEHAALLDALGRMRRATARLSDAARRSADAYARGTTPADAGEVSRTFDAWQAARGDVDRRVARLGLGDCRGGEG